LAPVPHRGKRNEPAFVRETAVRIAMARGLTVEALGALTDQTVDRFFRRPPQ
jgi:TatD DNase family protein